MNRFIWSVMFLAVAYGIWLLGIGASWNEQAIYKTLNAPALLAYGGYEVVDLVFPSGDVLTLTARSEENLNLSELGVDDGEKLRLVFYNNTNAKKKVVIRYTTSILKHMGNFLRHNVL